MRFTSLVIEMSQERLSIGRNDGSPLKWKMFREPLALNKRSKKICVWSVLQAVSGRGLYWHANYKSPEEIWQICARLGRVMRFCNLCQALIPMSIICISSIYTYTVSPILSNHKHNVYTYCKVLYKHNEDTSTHNNKYIFCM